MWRFSKRVTDRDASGMQATEGIMDHSQGLHNFCLAIKHFDAELQGFGSCSIVGTKPATC